MKTENQFIYLAKPIHIWQYLWGKRTGGDKKMSREWVFERMQKEKQELNYIRNGAWHWNLPTISMLIKADICNGV